MSPGTDGGRPADAPTVPSCVVAGRTGDTACPASPSGMCAAGQFCDSVMLTCSLGCTSDANCPGDELCVRAAGEAVGACAPCVRCGDGRCDPGESCTADCGAAPVCGDGACNGTETTATCLVDCPSAPRCGDGICNGTESPATCAADCASGPVCGDGVCAASENMVSCAEDCDNLLEACFGICNNFEFFECIPSAAPCVSACNAASRAQRQAFSDCVNPTVCETHDACIGLL